MDDAAGLLISMRVVQPALSERCSLERAAQRPGPERDALPPDRQGIPAEEPDVLRRSRVDDPTGVLLLEVPVPKREEVVEGPLDDVPGQPVGGLDLRAGRPYRSAFVVARPENRARSRAIDRGAPLAVDQALVDERQAEAFVRTENPGEVEHEPLVPVGLRPDELDFGSRGMPEDSDTKPTLHRALARGRGPPNGERPVAHRSVDRVRGRALDGAWASCPSPRASRAIRSQVRQV